MTTKVLIVEDDDAVRQVVRRALPLAAGASLWQPAVAKRSPRSVPTSPT